MVICKWRFVWQTSLTGMVGYVAYLMGHNSHNTGWSDRFTVATVWREERRGGDYDQRKQLG